MAIELTTADNSIITSIRETLKAVSGGTTIKYITDVTRASFNSLTPASNTIYVVNEGSGVNSSLYFGSKRIDFSGSITGNLSASNIVYALSGNSTQWNNSTSIVTSKLPPLSSSQTGTATNVSIIQRDSGGTNQWVNVLGSANPNKLLGFNSSGVLSAVSAQTIVPFGAAVVETEAELRAQIGTVDNTIFIKGTINLTSALTLSAAGVTIMGFNPSQSKLVMADSATTATRVIFPNAPRITIRGITIQGNNTAATRQHGIISEGTRNNSNLTVADCEIKTVYHGITQSGAESATPNENIRILNNKFSDFVGGIYWAWGTIGLDVIGNTIIGDGSEFVSTAKSKWNAIWIGLGILNLHVCNNTVGSVQRMGIEIFWPHKFNPDTGGSADYSDASKNKADAGIVITGNVVYDCGSMGISLGGNRNGIVSNNSISNVRWVGLELVGDATTSAGGVARPNANVNMTVVGNSIYNVNAQPRGLKKAYKPTHSTTSTPINTHFAATGSVNLNTVVTGTTVVTITLASPYPTLQVGKQLIAKDTALPTTNTFTAKIVTYDSATGVITALVSAKTGTDTVSNWSVFIRRTVVLQLDSTTAMAWGTNASSATSGWTVNSLGVHVLDQETNTLSIKLQNTAAAADQLTGFLTAYNSTTQQATIELTSTTGVNTSTISSWKAFNHNVLVAVSIDQINGVLFSQNTINTIVDTTRPVRTNNTADNVAYGVQIYLSKNIHVVDNVWTRCGQLAVFVNNSLDVCVEDNKFVSPVVDGTTSDGISVTRAVSGANTGSLVYDPSNPLTELGEDKGENGGVAVYVVSSQKTIVRRNYVRNSTANDLLLLTNGSEIYSNKFTRPESGRFGSDVYLRTNDFREISNYDTAWPSPPVDYTVRWNNATQEFTGYRFHVDPNLSMPESKAFAVSVGASKYIYNWYLESDSTVSSPLSTTVALRVTGGLALPALKNDYLADPNAIAPGTFIRAVAVSGGVLQATQYFEGIVTNYNTATTTLTANTYFNTLTASYDSWRLYCDQDAMYVSKTGDLVLRHDLRSDKTIGTKIGQLSSEKFAFWGKTPTTQLPTVSAASSTADVVAQLNLVIDRLKTLGLIAS